MRKRLSPRCLMEQFDKDSRSPEPGRGLLAVGSEDRRGVEEGER